MQSLHDLARDATRALRSLRRAPGFTAAVIVTLGLGIGANAAMFGVLDELMFRPFTYLRDPGAVHRVYFRTEDRGVPTTRWDAEYTRYLDLARWTTSFAQTAAFTHRTMAVRIEGTAREQRVAAVSAGFFDFFDMQPALGRFFAATEDATPRGADVAVLGYDFWRREFGGRDVRGEVLQVGDIRATIVGVTPPRFSGVEDADPPAVYVPITTYAGAQPDSRRAATYFLTYQWRWMEIMVRRKDGVSIAQASADVTQAYRRSWNVRREIEPSLPPLETARPTALVSAIRLGGGPNPSLEARTALWVTGVAAMVLLIACSNVANLLLTRALQRQRDLALRLALGARRSHLVWSVLLENLMLAFASGLVGLLIAEWGGAAIRRLWIPAGVGGGEAWEVIGNARIMIVGLGIAVAAAVLTGLAAALLSGRGEHVAMLGTGVRGERSHRSRLRGALLVLQGALSVTLLIGAGLFVRSLEKVKGIRLGYDADRVLVVNAHLNGVRLGDSARIALGRRLLATAQASLDVERASWVNSVPFRDEFRTRLFVAGIDSVERLGNFTYEAVSADYFATMGTRILRGRAFTPDDRGGAAHVVVVSEAMARTLWPGQEALGQCMRVFADTMPCARVVGVAEDIVQRDVSASTQLHYYLPIEQFFPTSGTALLLRLRTNPAQHGDGIRKTLQAVMPGQSYVTLRPLLELVDGARRSWQLGATLFGAFGMLAALVAGVGLYGVMAHDVTRRQHELGVRMALGARASDIIRLVVGRGVRLTSAGILVGATLALVAAQWLQPLLFQQSATDVRVFASVAGIMLVVALVATTSPAVRAARADPNAALRAE